MAKKTKLKIGCPKCGGPVGQESGFYACLSKACGWHDLAWHKAASWQGSVYDDPEGYVWVNGAWRKVGDKEKELDF